MKNLNEDIKKLSQEEGLKIINSFNWTKAKTAIKNPHEYIVVHEGDPRRSDWELLAKHILTRFDYIEKFWGIDYKIAEFGNRRYWMMISSIDELHAAFIINRSIPDEPNIS